jgi:predicted regulator of Ras-like GTPase activity (Roadblock/LC7/MglB family)
MSLKNTLTEIVENIPGGRAVVIMASDGIPIDQVVLDEGGLDLQLLTVEYSTLLGDIRRAVELLEVGEMEEISITSGEMCVVLRVLTRDLFVILVMDRDANVGKGRYLLRLRSHELSRMLL